MARKLLTALLVLTVLAAVAYPTMAFPESLEKKGKKDPCFAMNTTTCAAAVNCTACSFFGSKPTCFPIKIAEKLPPFIADCGLSAEPTPLSSSCDSIVDSTQCSTTEGCVWCASAAVPSSCFSTEDAKKLPAAVFQCDAAGAGWALNRFFGNL